MGKKKAFIDRKNATKFRLLHRSQKDPLIVDDRLGEHVLHPIGSNSKATKDMEERRKYGIYYRDDYDYLRHLKQVGEAVDLDGLEEVEQELIQADNPLNRLPSCIFETRGVELKVGLLNQVASSNELLPNIDPDVAAALDGDLEATEGGDELEDDFVQMANGGETEGGGQDWAPGDELRDEMAGREEMMRRFGLENRGMRQERFSDESSADEEDEEMEEADEDNSAAQKEDCKSRFTNYSMSSAVIKRPDGLRHIDDHFETFYSKQYGEEELGETDGEGTEEADPALIAPESERFRELLEAGGVVERRFHREQPDPELKESVLRSAEAKERQEAEEQNEEDVEKILVPVDKTKRGRWDCESILSAQSNLYNHPTEIREFGMSSGKRKRGITKGDLKTLEKMDQSTGGGVGVLPPNVLPPASRCSTQASTIRTKGETAEERRERKKAVKGERRERRIEKKTNKETFREEKLAMGAQRRNVLVKARPIF